MTDNSRKSAIGAGTRSDDAVIWRYMDVAKYVTLLERGLFFARPSRLGDHWEGAWGTPDARAFRDARGKADPAAINVEWTNRHDQKTASLDGYGVSCWHIAVHESAALWSLYFPRGFGVAVRSTVRELLASLEASGRIVEPREVRYIDYSEVAVGDDPRDLLSHKRQSFAPEKELRFLLSLRADEIEWIRARHVPRLKLRQNAGTGRNGRGSRSLTPPAARARRPRRRPRDR